MFKVLKIDEQEYKGTGIGSMAVMRTKETGPILI